MAFGMTETLNKFCIMCLQSRAEYLFACDFLSMSFSFHHR